MPTVKLFQNLTKDDKLDMFCHAQDMLIQHHPNSSFMFRRDNLEARLSFAKTFLANYKGFAYMDDNIVIFFNKIFVDNPKEPLAAIKAHHFKEPVEHYNAIMIDFVVFKELKECANWVKGQYDPRIQYVLYVKNSKPQIYPVHKLISKVFEIPLAVG